ncbi:hypothetical protein GOP47_0020451 [Adiantum capillus-veneris]|uniref:Uncharacterized protein n=1 Tax=Adiantum capillus-veneris TaxID=13818 RepID=A0A9D4UB41_ADICA|nr:hypothetical protein GOP47_0020451 [Adiantum capillus-veneris]
MVVVVVSVMMWPAEGRHLDDASRRPVSLAYHGGPLLTSPSLILHLFWYGSFSASQQAAIMDFISSFQAGSSSPAAGASTVASWWKGVSLYTDASHARASTLLKLGSTASNPSCSFGKGLTRAQISQLLEDSISTGLLPQHTNTDVIYIVFTSSDVVVESFCMSSCGYHSSVMSGQLPFIWVGNAERQCLGLCAWPFAVPQYGPRGRKALVPPSGDAATDGMIINLATLLAGAVTNPFGQGYFPDAVDANTMYTNGSSAPAARGNVEAATACAGMFGKDSYPGFPGTLLLDATSGAAYNAYGFNQRRFLLPALWSPTTTKCQPPPS